MSLLTSTPLKVAPSAATGLTVTSGGSTWTNGSWVEFISSAPAALQIAGIVIGWSGDNDQCEYDIGVGAVSSEVVIATIRVTPSAPQNWSGLGVWMLPAPIDNVANGSRVAIRCRGVFTSASRIVALQYYQGLNSDNSTALATAALPPASSLSITPNASSWANSAWVQLTAGIGNEISIVGLAFQFITQVEMEFDIGTGGSGSETVITTLRTKVGGTKGAIPQYANLPAPFPIAASTRVAVRLRKNDTNTTVIGIAAVYYNNTSLLGGTSGTGAVTIGAPSVSGAGTETITGSGGATISVPSVQGSPTISGSGGVAIGYPSVDGAGTVVDDLGSRVEISRPSVSGSGAETITGDGAVTIGVSTVSGAGSAPAVTPLWSTNRQYAAPAAATGLSITPNSTTWAWSNWFELDPSTAAAWLMSGLVVTPDQLGPGASAEFEVGVGAAGSEIAVDRFRGHWGNTFYASAGELPRSVLLDAVAALRRVSLRMRKSNTSVTPWHVKASYYRKPLTGSVLSSAKPQKTYPEGANHITLTVGASAWATSTTTTLIASAAADLLLVGILPYTAGVAADWEFDVCVGANDAAAVRVTSVRFRHNGIQPVDGPTLMPLYTPLNAIPAGSRVSVRTRSSVVASVSAACALIGMELPL